MAVIKVENADPHSSIPLVFDVMGETEKEPLATHRLLFGQFVTVDSLENLHMVSVEEWQARQAEAAEAEAKAAKNEQAATSLSAAAADVAEPEAKLKRRYLEEMTKDELVAYADNHDIEVNQHWTKADIVDAIVKG